ncbi:MAG: glutathione S-transferase family protein [Gammaproteobacteria bacterium]|nr:glutathione S-transferase family protein [Gammaproteobacteria bacterium]MDH3431373.1 glutathione S-transferase family protein [Gammaproteobacteria bacterium]MDH3434477.1 glutathione S-transferase family protein [Gammaproteobacteria bacterium]
MKLYDCTTAPSPRRVRIFAAEKGIELDKVQIDLANGAQFSDDFRAINPDCVVPVLELDDGTHITEVLAICQYLEELYPEPSLFGRTPAERASTIEWHTKIEQQGLMPMRDAFRNSAKGLKGHALTGPVQYEQIPELAERSRHCVTTFFERLERQLAGNEYVAGAFYSIADITALVLADFAAWIKIGLPDGAVNLLRWHQKAASRPSAKA